MTLLEHYVYGYGLYVIFSSTHLSKVYGTYVALNYVAIIQTETPSENTLRELPPVYVKTILLCLFRHITTNIADIISLLIELITY